MYLYDSMIIYLCFVYSCMGNAQGHGGGSVTGAPRLLSSGVGILLITRLAPALRSACAGCNHQGLGMVGDGWMVGGSLWFSGSLQSENRKF